MAFCRHCGAQLGEGARFCRQCGSQVPEYLANAPAQVAAVNIPAPEDAKVTVSDEPPADFSQKIAEAARTAQKIAQAAIQVRNVTASSTPGESIISDWTM